MVKVDKSKGYVYYFWSNEVGGGGRIEPPHIHVSEGIPQENGTKFWLDPVRLEHNNGKIKNSDLREIERYINDNQRIFLEKWNEYFK